jgi:hypothetical protein
MKNGNFNCRHWEKIIVVDQLRTFFPENRPEKARNLSKNGFTAGKPVTMHSLTRDKASGPGVFDIR